MVPEPNTWREIVKATESRHERKIFIHCGNTADPAAELTAGLPRARSRSDQRSRLPMGSSH